MLKYIKRNSLVFIIISQLIPCDLRQKKEGEAEILGQFQLILLHPVISLEQYCGLFNAKSCFIDR